MDQNQVIKQKQENMDDDENNTIDDLKKVEEDLVKLTSMIDQMRGDLQQRN